jgi:hypothetical protein
VTLPKGWSETEPRSNRPGTWRFQVRSSKRFRVGTLRTVPLEGIKGVKLIAGKLRSGDPEISRHKGPDVMIPQAVIFLKPEWGEFRRALAWQESHFTAIGPTLENPRFPARRGKYKILTVPEQHQLRIAKDTLRMSDAGARIMGGMTKAEARAIIRKFLGAAALSFFDAADPPIDNPPRGRYRIHIGYTKAGRDKYRYFATLEAARSAADRVFQATGTVLSITETPRKRQAAPQGPHIEPSTPEESIEHPEWPYRLVDGSSRFGLSVADAVRAQKLGTPFKPASPEEPLENPPKGSLPQIERAYNEGYNNGRIDKSVGRRSEYAFTEERGDSLEHSDSGVRWRTAYTMGYRDGWNGSDRRRSFGGERENPPRAVQASRAAASVAIDKLVHIETEISALFVQALELQSRGERMPDWMADRIRGAQLEKKAALEDVRQAVGRHGATIEEFHVPRSRRANPSARGGRAAAVKLYQEFHGVAPKGFTTRNVPDLSQLVHLGRALRVDYQAARPRGPRGTPYRHAFDAGSELFTDRTGRALVILGNIKVSRAPRGRFGYIRAGAGE